jgi:DNA-binding NarL/FixJ family response regulator
MLNRFQLDPRDRVAIFTFTDSMQLLYMNEMAQDLVRQVTVNGAAATGVIPPEIIRICEELRGKTDSVRTHIQRESLLRETRFLFQGFSIPVDQLTGIRLIVVLAEPITCGWEQARESFGLTQREKDVAELLVKGLTNKEIGVHLQLAEQTIKEHIKHIMEKTDTSTRTELVAHLFTSHDTRAARLREERDLRF